MRRDYRLAIAVICVFLALVLILVLDLFVLTNTAGAACDCFSIDGSCNCVNKVIYLPIIYNNRWTIILE